MKKGQSRTVNVVYKNIKQVESDSVVRQSDDR